MSMCSAIQPSSRAMVDAMRSAKHFFPSRAFSPHGERLFTVVSRTGAVFCKRATEGAILNTRDITGVRPGVIAARSELLVQLYEGLILDQPRAKLFVFLVGAIYPLDVHRVGQ